MQSKAELIRLANLTNDFDVVRELQFHPNFGVDESDIVFSWASIGVHFWEVGLQIGVEPIYHPKGKSVKKITEYSVARR